MYLGVKYDLDRNAIPPKFDPTKVQTLQMIHSICHAADEMLVLTNKSSLNKMYCQIILQVWGGHVSYID